MIRVKSLNPISPSVFRLSPVDSATSKTPSGNSSSPPTSTVASSLLSSAKQDVDEDVEVNIDGVRDDDEWDGVDKRKHRSSKSRKPGSSEDADGLDRSARKRSATDRHENRKRVAGLSRADSDQDDYEARKERSKQMKKKIEVNALEKMSSWYQDGEAESKCESGDKSGSKVHSRADERARKTSSSKYSDHDFNVEKAQERDSRYSDRRDSGSEKRPGSVEHGRNSQRRWDESDAICKDNEYLEKSGVRSGKSSDPKLESARERSDTLKIEPGNSKCKGLDPIVEKGIKAQEREERRANSERSKRGKFEALEDIEISASHEDRSSKERFEETRLPINPTSQDVDSSNVSRKPERSGRRNYESDNFDMNYERSASIRRKEQGKDSSWDDRSKERDDSWVDKSRDRENIKDNWKRTQGKDARDGEVAYSQGRDWEFSRRGRERIDGERPHGRSGGRKDGSRTEAVKTSSKYGISNDNYDVIEIQTKPFDYGREESESMFVRSSEVVQSDTKLAPAAEEFGYSRSEKSRSAPGSGSSGEGSKERYIDGGFTMPDSRRDDMDYQAENSRVQRGVGLNHGASGQSSSSGLQLPLGNLEPGSFSRGAFQGVRGSRVGRGGRGRPPGRENQQGGIPMPLIGSPFGPLGIPPPGPMQSLTPNMSPAPVPPIPPGVFIPPFQPPVWPGARGIEMNMLAVPPGLPHVPPGPLGPRFPTNIGNPPNPALFFNPSGPGRGTSPSMSGPNFNANAPSVCGQPLDNAFGGWVPSRSNGSHGKAPSRGEQNDYSQNFVDTGMRPQNFIRELELTSVVEDYPKLRELIQKKDEIVAKSSSPPMYFKCDLREQVLSPEFFATKFDVILVDPPWEEYVHRAPGVTDHMEYWTFEEIMNLKIEAIADTPSFIFLWVGDGVGLEQGRQCLKKEHCLMGIKGTVRRSTDGHVIHANIDTDVIIAEEPPYGSTSKPEDMYRIIEHFALGRRRLELFGEDHNIRSGWLTVGKGLSSSNFNSEAYIRRFMDKDGKVWQGGGGRNPPPEAPHLVLTTPEIEALRPKSPMKNQLQMQQQQSASITLTTSNSNNKRTTGNSPQDHNAPNLNQEASSSNVSTPGPWASPMQSLKGRESGYMSSDDRAFDVYGYNAPSFGPANGDFSDYDTQRGMNML
ncbi:methyltransferase-like protein 1 isoform X2 [Olea europaea var. sylvestris]|uniref:methyltransferase-like protein 1 isoform X2 n=1 Tax=Olea europaea var. sylvestris TaxID=158386 RepID=UPI000C1CCE95|nr:methyltransferase-like protein 1 isoform X2 [Olea europaea var. sylvestris]